MLLILKTCSDHAAGTLHFRISAISRRSVDSRARECGRLRVVRTRVNMSKGWAHAAKRRRRKIFTHATTSAQHGDRHGDRQSKVDAHIDDRSDAHDAEDLPVAGSGQGILRRIARALWSNDYSALFASEHLINGAACPLSGCLMPRRAAGPGAGGWGRERGGGAQRRTFHP